MDRRAIGQTSSDRSQSIQRRQEQENGKETSEQRLRRLERANTQFLGTGSDNAQRSQESTKQELPSRDLSRSQDQSEAVWNRAIGYYTKSDSFRTMAQKYHVPIETCAQAFENYVANHREDVWLDRETLKVRTRAGGDTPEEIERLANQFIARAQGEEIPRLRITDEQYDSVRNMLKSYKNNGTINSAEYNKANKSAYNSSNAGRESTAKYKTSTVGKETIAEYESSDARTASRERSRDKRANQENIDGYEHIYVPKASKARYDESNPEKAKQAAFRTRKRLLNSPEGRQQLREDYDNWESGNIELPGYVSTGTFFIELMDKNKLRER